MLVVWLLLLLAYMLPFVHPPSTLMIAGWLRGESVQREWLPLNHMSTALVRGAIAAEDARFCKHGGVDWQALRSVAEEALEGEKPRGASTITMQLMKNLFLWPDRSYVRKVLEVPMALTADVLLGKRRIIELYLNVAELGNGIYGVQAAAQAHYGQSARWLQEDDAAKLMAILPNPKRNPKALSPEVAAYARRIEARAGHVQTDCVLP